MKANGQLQHHFWGTYAASIVLQFDDAVDAAVALAHYFPGWHVHKTHRNVLAFHGSGEPLEAALTTLETHGADRGVVESCRKSIDFGEPFAIDVQGCDRAALEARGQQPLFTEAR